MEEFEVALTPYTGFHCGKMKCVLFKDRFELTVKREAIFQFNVGKKYIIPFSEIQTITQTNYLFVSGIDIKLYERSKVEFPSSTAKAVGGIIGALIGTVKHKKFILYFDCKESNKLFMQYYIESTRLKNK